MSDESPELTFNQGGAFSASSPLMRGEWTEGTYTALWWDLQYPPTRPEVAECWLLHIPAVNLRIPWPKGMTAQAAMEAWMREHVR